MLSGYAWGDDFPRDQLTIQTQTGRHVFNVEVARTPQQRAQGLMHRSALASDAGMLFDYGYPQPVSMWMKNTLIPLDMLFIGPKGIIESVRVRAVPHSLDSISSKGDVRAVLELNGGATERLGIKSGDQVIHPIFGASD